MGHKLILILLIGISTLTSFAGEKESNRVKGGTMVEIEGKEILVPDTPPPVLIKEIQKTQGEVANVSSEKQRGVDNKTDSLKAIHKEQEALKQEDLIQENEGVLFTPEDSIEAGLPD